MQILPAGAVDNALLAALGIAAAALAFFIARERAGGTVVVWLLVLCFVPVWVGVGIGFNGNVFLPGSAVLAFVAAAALLPASRFRFGFVDALVVLLLTFALVSLFTGNSSIALAFVVSFATYFVSGYVLGRLAPLRVDERWIYSAVAVVFTAVAVLAIVEFLTGLNPFVLIPVHNSLYSAWATLQPRGGVIRAEGAFGHSIALGSSLAIAIPFTLASRFPMWARAAMTLTMLIATVLTFSRIGIITALLGVMLSAVFLRHAFTRRTAVLLTSLLALAAAVLFPLVTTVFQDAGSEASGSAAYRVDLLSLLGSMNLVGVADSARRAATGTVYFGNFQSIDSQLILTGLTNGMVALVLVIVALAAGVVLVLAGRASAATIAVVAQIPAFATVALITQYSIFIWFAIGMAASTQFAAGAKATGTSLDVGAPQSRPVAPSAGPAAGLPARRT